MSDVIATSVSRKAVRFAKSQIRCAFDLPGRCEGAPGMSATTLEIEGIESPRPRTQDIDRHIGTRLRQRRVTVGLTQQRLADLIGVTCQQANKYENGVNRISASRLFVIAGVLSVDVGYFYEGLQGDPHGDPSPQQRVFLDHARSFRSIRTRKHQEAICLLTRIVANLERGGGMREG